MRNIMFQSIDQWTCVCFEITLICLKYLITDILKLKYFTFQNIWLKISSFLQVFDLKLLCLTVCFHFDKFENKSLKKGEYEYRDYSIYLPSGI